MGAERGVRGRGRAGCCCLWCGGAREDGGAAQGPPVQRPSLGERELLHLWPGHSWRRRLLCGRARSGVEMAPGGVVQRLICGRGLPLSLGRNCCKRGRAQCYSVMKMIVRSLLLMKMSDLFPDLEPVDTGGLFVRKSRYFAIFSFILFPLCSLHFSMSCGVGCLLSMAGALVTTRL